MVYLTLLGNFIRAQQLRPDQMPLIREQFFPRRNSLTFTHGRKANEAVLGYSVGSPLRYRRWADTEKASNHTGAT